MHGLTRPQLASTAPTASPRSMFPERRIALPDLRIPTDHRPAHGALAKAIRHIKATKFLQRIAESQTRDFDRGASSETAMDLRNGMIHFIL